MFAKQVKHNSLWVQKQHKPVLHLPVKAPVDEIMPLTRLSTGPQGVSTLSAVRVNAIVVWTYTCLAKHRTCTPDGLQKHIFPPEICKVFGSKVQYFL